MLARRLQATRGGSTSGGVFEAITVASGTLLQGEESGESGTNRVSEITCLWDCYTYFILLPIHTHTHL